MLSNKKVIGIILLMLCFQMTLFSQQVTLNLSNVTVKSAIEKLKKEYDYSFVFESGDVNTQKIISVKLRNQTIDEAVKQILSGQDVSYEIKGKNILVRKNKAKLTSVVLQGGKEVRGIVTDPSGEPVLGAGVLLKGTQTGTFTDLDGRFTLQANPDAVLVVSYLGMGTQEIAIGGRSEMTITLSELDQTLDDVVIIGYGTQKKLNLTGSVSAVSGDELVKRPVSNPTTMLQGQIPGLSIVQHNGQPGAESVSVRIRGQGTYSNAGSDPLILIDGVPGSLSRLNATDIESVSVLKDASSSAIYGARAANGVILVTTKTGQSNRFSLTYNVNWGIHTPTFMLKLVTNSADYMRLFNEAKQNSGIASSTNTYTNEMIALYENATDRTKYPNFDWIDYALNPAYVKNHNLSLSGGNKETTYNISIGYIDQPGTLIGYKFDKYNFRVNLKSQLKNWITIGTNLFFERGDVDGTAQGPDDAMWALTAQAPTYGPKLPDGRYTYSAYPFESHNKNQVAIVENEVMKNTINYDSSVQLWLELKLLPGLSWYTKGAVNYVNANSKDWRPEVPVYNYHTGASVGFLDVGTKGLTVTNDRTFYTNLFSYLKYEKTFQKSHSVGIQFGYSQETSRYEYQSGYRQTFLSRLQELNAGTTDIQNANGYAYEWALMSFFGRMNYNYEDRYLIELNARRDGTSRMSTDNRWGWFPSFSAGWRLSEEKFVRDLELSWLNNLKLRGSYGLLGNQNININGQPYPYQSMLSFTGNYPFDNTTLSTGIAQTEYANKKIKWESTSIFDVGMDVTVLRGLSVSYDYYRKKTSDILRSAQTSALLGLSAPIVNSGAMINYGHEVSIQYAGRINNGTFSGLQYGSAVYFNKYRNEAANFGTEEIGSYDIRKNGIPYNSFYILQCIGVFQTPEEIAASPKQFGDNVKPGDLKYADVNRDGKVDNDDKIVIDGKFPKFEYSLNAYATWKGFDISAFFQGINGRRVYLNMWETVFRQGAAPTIEWLNERWNGPGTSNWYPRITFDANNNSQNTRSSSWWLRDASYFRLKNLVVGYTIPQNITSRIKSEKIRIYFSGDNLLTVTSFKNVDPERANDGANFALYPQNKIISFGLNVEF